MLGTLRVTASSRRNLFVFDSFEVLCPPGIGVCSATRDGVPLMRDRDHLNARGAASLSADFLRFLQQNGLYTPVATSRNVRDPAWQPGQCSPRRYIVIPPSTTKFEPVA